MRVVPTTLMGQSSAWALLKSAACSMNMIPIKNALASCRGPMWYTPLSGIFRASVPQMTP